MLCSLKFIRLNSKLYVNQIVTDQLKKIYCISAAMSLPFVADYDKRGIANCKKCKTKMEKGILRIAKMVSNPFGSGTMKAWHHLDCIFDTFLKARAATKTITDPNEDIEGFSSLQEDDQKSIEKKTEEYLVSKNLKASTPKKNQKKAGATINSGEPTPEKQKPSGKEAAKNGSSKPSKDDMFREFRKLCNKIADVDSYNSKTQIVSDYLNKGTSGEKFQGDYKLWVRFLLPGVIKRVYNLQSKQLLKLFSNIFDTNLEEMTEDLEKGDVAETVRTFFEKSASVKPAKSSTLTLQAVDEFLEELSTQTKEDAQSHILKKISKLSTGNDLKMVIRLIKGDLRINAGAKHILSAVHGDAYEAFKSTRDLDTVLNQVLGKSDDPDAKDSGTLNVAAKVMTPVQPMLAEACRSIEQAMKKCPNGMYAEIKYDGERVQVHKQGNSFQYYSRSLKPVMAHKVAHFKDYLPSAFPHGHDLILDCEVLLIDTNTSIPLPFGTLGSHKKTKFQDACVCLFVFDCIHYNGENLMDRTIQERRSILEKNMLEVKNRVVFSEMKEVQKAGQLAKMIDKVLQQGLEGLVLKDLKSIYKPGKRHWLKVKKDYLKGGSMADSADLVVLGAWYGTGKKGGMMSVFLMGCYNPLSKKWCTVTKVHTGFDDAALERLQTELDMLKISQNSDLLPPWLNCSKSLIPDFVASDPKKSPVWEVTGAEFTKHDKHTANGISVRFPRVTKERPDKDWKDATDLERLKDLYNKSKEHTDVVGLKSSDEDDDDNEGSSSPDKLNQMKKKIKQTKLHFSEKRTHDDSYIQNKKIKKENGFDNIGTIDTPFTVNPLPDVFKGIKLHIPTNLEDSSTLQRYFIAFGGALVDEYSSEGTHEITEENSKSTKKLVKVDWLWDSIKLKQLQPERFYQPN